MNRIVAFGCSHTYGSCLEDCVVFSDEHQMYLPKDEPSKLAWPSILGQLMSLGVINKSRPGASNKEILWSLLHYKDFSNSDIVIIQWTHLTRHLIINESAKDSKRLTRLNLNHKSLDKRNLVYFRHFYCSEDAAWELFRTIDHVNLRLAGCVNKVVHLFSDLKEVNIKPTFTKINLDQNRNFTQFMIDNDCKKAIDGQHWNSAAQVLWAKHVYSMIKNEL